MIVQNATAYLTNMQSRLPPGWGFQLLGAGPDATGQMRGVVYVFFCLIFLCSHFLTDHNCTASTSFARGQPNPFRNVRPTTLTIGGTF